jgi:hypothetical protein
MSRNSIKYHKTSFPLFFDICDGDGAAGGAPDAQDADMLLVLLDMKNDSINTISFAEEQMAGGIAKLFCFGNDGAAGGKFFQAENGLE